MARKLNSRHIKILERVFNETQAIEWDAIPFEERQALEKVNYYETLWSDAERWLMDRQFKNKLNK